MVSRRRRRGRAHLQNLDTSGCSPMSMIGTAENASAAAATSYSTVGLLPSSHAVIETLTMVHNRGVESFAGCMGTYHLLSPQPFPRGVKHSSNWRSTTSGCGQLANRSSPEVERRGPRHCWSDHASEGGKARSDVCGGRSANRGRLRCATCGSVRCCCDTLSSSVERLIRRSDYRAEAK